ncbi:MAG: DMT family transporter [Lachnospiraceae bacterium]|nr:DMT family transporter [Lachnospiraceae bacterium]
MRPKNTIALFITAIIWGTAFVAQRQGMDYIGPLTFNAVRTLLAFICLVIFVFLRNKLIKRDKKETIALMSNRKYLYSGGIACGVLLFTASTLQQTGIVYTTAGKAGFITSFYIVLVPVAGVFLKKKTGILVWIAVLLAFVGLYLLCITEKFTIQKGDFLILICSVAFMFHILTIDYCAPKVDEIMMSTIQFGTSTVLSFAAMFLFEESTIAGVWSAIWPIIFVGIFSGGVGYTLQMVGQKNANPTISSLIMSLEACFAVLAGWLILHENLSGRELLGCVLMSVAIILAQLKLKTRKTITTTIDRSSIG